MKIVSKPIAKDRGVAVAVKLKVIATHSKS